MLIPGNRDNGYYPLRSILLIPGSVYGLVQWAAEIALFGSLILIGWRVVRNEHETASHPDFGSG